MTEKEKEITPQLHPFDVRHFYEALRDTREQNERRYGALSDLFHQMQLGFKEQDTFLRTKLDHVEQRYVNGPSRSIQDVKGQNAEIQKAFAEFQGVMRGSFAETDKRISLLAQESSARFDAIALKFDNYDTWKKEFRDFGWKLLFWFLTAALGAVGSLFFYINSVKTKIDQIPAVLAYQDAVKAAAPGHRAR